MKRTFAAIVFALLCSTITYAQDSTKLKKHRPYPSRDSVPSTADSTGRRKWHKDKMPGTKRKNWPDSMGKITDTVRKRD